MVGVFLDIEKAYDMVWHHGLLLKLSRLGVQGRLFSFLENFVCERSIRVVYLYIGILSDSHPVSTGLPQGSILSPTLFTIYNNDIFDGLPPGFRFSMFADDCAFWARSHDFDMLCHRVQRAFNVVDRCCSDFGLLVSGGKSSFVVFSKRKVPYEPHFVVGQQRVAYKTSVKFLGMVFDNRLTWEKHIRYVADKVVPALSLMAILSHTSWGSDRSLLLRIYFVMVRSVLDYGCFLYSTASQTSLLILDRVQYKAIRLCIGALRCTRVDQLEVESSVLPLWLRRMQMGLCYLAKVFVILDHPVSVGFRNYYPFDFYNIRPHPLPFYGRALVLLGDRRDYFLSMGQFSERGKYIFPCCKFDLSLSNLVKGCTSEVVYRARFSELLDSYVGYSFIFTDGSVEGARCSSAFWVENVGYSWSSRLTDGLCIFTAELFAISQAVAYIARQVPGCFAIFCDSLSVVLALKSAKILHYLVHDVLQSLSQLVGYTVFIVWIPGHRGSLGNERADALARRALLAGDVVDVSVSLVEWRTNVRRDVLLQWQNNWSLQHSWLRNIKPSVGRWLTASRYSRREEVVLSRLRLGSCLL